MSINQKFGWSVLFSAIALRVSLLLCPLFLGLYLVCNSASPVKLDVPLPKGTEIVEQWDTHKGFFRTEGTAVTVALVPPEHRADFFEKLQECGFSLGRPSDEANALLRRVENSDVDNARFSDWVLWAYQRAQVNTSSEPIPDGFAAIYDPDSGICCWVEFDGAWLI